MKPLHRLFSRIDTVLSFGMSFPEATFIWIGIGFLIVFVAGMSGHLHI